MRQALTRARMPPTPYCPPGPIAFRAGGVLRTVRLGKGGGNSVQDMDNLAGQPPAPLRPIALRILRIWLILTLTARVGGLWATYGISGIYRDMQDRWLLLLVIGVGVAAVYLPGSGLWRTTRAVMSERKAALWAAGLALMVAVVGYAGHYLLLSGYDLSRDEQMAVFDARIYASGHLAWPIARAWHFDSAALNMLFMLPISRPAAWVSAYLPGNALIRAVFGLLGDPALANPAMSAAAVLAVWGVARRLWPEADARGDAVLAALLLALSGQVLMTGMTAYAMPAHLLANLVWLWLFLADRRRTDAAAVVLGFVATGLHQPLFHPLFVAPFMALLLWQRRWGRLAFFVVPYAAIGLFWLAWPNLVTIPLVTSPDSHRDVGADVLSRLIDTLGSNSENLPMMACNLLRFMTWQAVPLVPLLIAGFWALWRNRRGDGVMLAMAAGLVAPVVVMVLILPYQGHGFGYRYLHQVLGNGVLLAVYGWRWLEPWQAQLRTMLMRALLGTALVLVPAQAWFAHRLYAPFARTSARINAARADYAMIGASDAPFALDLVLNRADLSNRPIRLSTIDIEDSDRLAAHICRNGATIALPADSFYADINAAFHVRGAHEANKRLPADRAQYGDAGCRVIELR